MHLARSSLCGLSCVSLTSLLASTQQKMVEGALKNMFPISVSAKSKKLTVLSIRKTIL